MAGDIAGRSGQHRIGRTSGSKASDAGSENGGLSVNRLAQDLIGAVKDDLTERAAERRIGDFVRSLIEDGKVTACHDVSDGGILVAIAEMALSGSIGATLQVPENGAPGDNTHAHAWLFGEAQGRYLVTPTDANG